MTTNRRLRKVAGSLLALVALAALSSCATKGFVREQVASARTYTDSRVGEVSGSVDDVRTRAEQANLLAERLAAGQYNEVSAHQVGFEFDDFRLSGEAQSMLDQLAAQLASHPRYVLEVRGFADAIGTDRYNYKLGRERADEVVRYMMTRHSVPSTRVVALSFGEENPVADNSSSSGRAQNRRVHVRVLELSAPLQPAAVMQAP
jgi:outer membrane protein OmpA-like peptidoglycan-associated protein